ncbi:MAG: hypothetical protein AB7Q17_00090 [Phycisphaerae bacterium]
MAIEKNRATWSAIAVVVILASGYWIFRDSVAQEKFARNVPLDGVCLACKHEVTSRVKTASDIPPYECPKCHQNAVLNWWYCGKCKKRIIPHVVKPSPGLVGIAQPPRCPICRSTTIEIFVPGLEWQRPTGDAALPTYP